ncbi:hypothetical protein KFE98_02710 [bacterium SCSIO 12741]|nr:hypothetical protein KFE98_02710 [bacterium SCSIO 12741]
MSTNETKTSPAASSDTQQVSNPLTFVFELKSPEYALKAKNYLASAEVQEKVNDALIKIGTVHFARFVFLSPLQLSVITTYDGDFDKYIQAFTDELGDIFDTLIGYSYHPDGLIPVAQNLANFQDYVRKNDRSFVDGVLQPEFSAYPTLTVYQILSLQNSLPNG